MALSFLQVPLLILKQLAVRSNLSLQIGLEGRLTFRTESELQPCVYELWVTFISGKSTGQPLLHTARQ